MAELFHPLVCRSQPAWVVPAKSLPRTPIRGGNPSPARRFPLSSNGKGRSLALLSLSKGRRACPVLDTGGEGDFRPPLPRRAPMGKR